MKTLKKINYTGKNVFLRVDFNIPIHQQTVLSDLRIRQTLKTIRYILKQRPRQLIIASHRGRPNGFDEDLSMKPIAQYLATLLKRKVFFHPQIDAPITSKSRIVVLENVRFWPGEVKGSKVFARHLAQHAQVYVNDAFATAHRKHASVFVLPKFFSKKAIGFLMEHELEEVTLEHPHPLSVIFGPAKIKDKLHLLHELLKKADHVLLGGGAVFTFLQAAGFSVGQSLVEKDMVASAQKMLKKYPEKIIFPVDFLALKPSQLSYSASRRRKAIRQISVEKIPSHLACYDIGPRSIALFSQIVSQSRTVIWNGPLGLFEFSPFNAATTSIAKVLATSQCISIICGGDTAAALKQTGYKQHMTHVSTGGGASLQLLANKTLPALEALEK